MASDNFTKETRLNKEETESLADFLNEDSKTNFRITAPEPKTAFDKTIRKMVRRVTDSEQKPGLRRLVNERKLAIEKDKEALKNFLGGDFRNGFTILRPGIDGLFEEELESGTLTKEEG